MLDDDFDMEWTSPDPPDDALPPEIAAGFARLWEAAFMAQVVDRQNFLFIEGMMATVKVGMRNSPVGINHCSLQYMPYSEKHSYDKAHPVTRWGMVLSMEFRGSDDPVGRSWRLDVQMVRPRYGVDPTPIVCFDHDCRHRIKVPVRLELYDARTHRGKALPEDFERIVNDLTLTRLFVDETG